MVTGLLESCQNYVVSKQSTLTHWHPVLGWFAQPLDPALQAATAPLKAQLHLLWHVDVIQILLGDFLAQLVEGVAPAPAQAPGFFKRMLEKGGAKGAVQRPYRPLGSPEVHRVVLICSMFHTALHTLTQLQLDILTGESLVGAGTRKNA